MINCQTETAYRSTLSTLRDPQRKAEPTIGGVLCHPRGGYIIILKAVQLY
ncbi:hypothetical protein U3516DRAFT_742450 [Neocallimastix sp. 'constans']